MNKNSSKTTKQQLIVLLPYLFVAVLVAKTAHVYNMVSTNNLMFLLDNTSLIISPLYWFNLKELGIGLIGGVFVYVAKLAFAPQKKNFKNGGEYGVARWGNAGDIAPYIDKNPYHNIILSKTERLSMEGRMASMEYNRNKNVIVIGGSGSGKTYLYVIPNLLQLDCSYIVTDPNR